MHKLIDHVSRWNTWRKGCTNNWLHKLLVLFGVIHSPTMMYTLTNKELKIIHDTVEGVLNGSHSLSMNDRIFPCDISGICPYQFEHCPSCYGYTQEELLAQTEDKEEQQ